MSENAQGGYQQGQEQEAQQWNPNVPDAAQKLPPTASTQGGQDEVDRGQQQGD